MLKRHCFVNIAVQNYLTSLKTYKREIFSLGNEKKKYIYISGAISLGTLSSIPRFTVNSVAVSNQFNLPKPFPHLDKK